MRPFHNVTAKGMTVTYGETVSREKPSQSDWLRNCGNATWKHELCIDLLLWQEQITCKLLCLSLSNVTLHKLVALAPDFRITGKRLVAFMKASNNHLCFHSSPLENSEKFQIALSRTWLSVLIIAMRWEQRSKAVTVPRFLPRIAPKQV
jgi:hypothetical protein